MDKAPPRTSQLSGMGWVSETLNTLGESHRMFRMNEFIFMDLHDVLVSRYGLKPSKFMNTYDFDMRFTYVAAGQPGAYHDTNVLYHAMEVDAQIFPHPPEGKNIHYLLSSTFYCSNSYAIFHMCRQVLCCGRRLS
jgi:hypothetical protein